ncbi:hypothetical protein THICB1_10205 [Thiomonas arsenitoxydans]|jgi:hypothetical protein|uniref:Uncharacterized protein n=1 Tax=Thiomonas arsenitoxydans (strain DSM 22701 / CIP 110005 / 3As) TaxID=426114 RepID=A0ABM9SZS9_THIA3|nr:MULTISPECIES: hypothetical protein [Thiomonas]MDE1979722.1 hypothetical protein [Betaproteobacteria bacterium]CQR44184.1 hypothetical protein THICB3490031 [Thiomonas sp. CB3]CQR26462.1 hypothetical protein THICB1_10205 [Thiomonas arsenitoxydans]CQR27906.1 hypothetical protein THICB6_130017 [Thiomonas arsenitoxydans]CQR35038.1 hypothetical protein ACO3_430016 [Thiomonas arsenitoxydans]
MSNGDVSNGDSGRNDSGIKELEDSGWFLGTLAAVAVIASAALMASVWFGLLGGAAK